MSGDTLDVIIENIKTRVNKTWTRTFMKWNMISDLMIELELPILKVEVVMNMQWNKKCLHGV